LKFSLLGGISVELYDYRKDYIETVRSLAVMESEFEEIAFVHLSADRLMEAEELDNFEHCYYEGNGKKNRKLMIHGYSFDDVEGSVKLVISSYSGREELRTLTQTELGKVFDRIKAFTEEAIAGVLHLRVDESSPCYGLAYQLYKRQNDIRRFKFYLVTDNILSNRVKDIAEDQIINKPVEYNVWDISRFHRVFESQIGKDPLYVDFLQYGNSNVLCLEAGQKHGEYTAYLCVIPGEVLAKVYDRFGSRLLEGNVRSFLSVKGNVNKGIRNTVINEPEMFFAYNNGISATATEAEFRKTELGLQLVSTTNLQIVNGGQTTASLLMAKLKDKRELSNIYVQMKLSVVTPETANNVIPMIARYANSQNQISEADFFSNHPFHVRIEGLSRRLWAPAELGAQYETHWFYERARGQYLNEQSKMTSAEQKKFLLQNPRNKLITKTDLGKYYFSWKGFPYLVSLGPQKNFRHFAQLISKQWDESDLEYNEDFFRNSVTYAILFKRTEALISEQPWYRNSYRPNFVTYTVALLAHMIDKNYEGMSLDLRAIWNRQALSDILVQQLVIVSKAAHDVIIKPELGIQIIPEWCKKELCWERVKEANVVIVEGFEESLISVSEIKKNAKNSKVQQKVDNGIEAQMKIFGLGVDYWNNLKNFAQQKRLVTNDEERLINLAVKMSNGVMPSDKQSLRLLGISERMTREGFAG
jgi:AIPR protein.